VKELASIDETGIDSTSKIDRKDSHSLGLVEAGTNMEAQLRTCQWPDGPQR
jgi:hypothetical protein